MQLRNSKSSMHHNKANTTHSWTIIAKERGMLCSTDIRFSFYLQQLVALVFVLFFNYSDKSNSKQCSQWISHRCYSALYHQRSRTLTDFCTHQAAYFRATTRLLSKIMPRSICFTSYIEIIFDPIGHLNNWKIELYRWTTHCWTTSNNEGTFNFSKFIESAGNFCKLKRLPSNFDVNLKLPLQVMDFLD